MNFELFTLDHKITANEVDLIRKDLVCLFDYFNCVLSLLRILFAFATNAMISLDLLR